MSLFDSYLATTKERISEVGAAELFAALSAPEPPVVVDIRERHEWDNGFIPGAHLLGRGHLEARIAKLVTDPDANVVLYCAGGVRSAFAADSLAKMGYRNVSSMAGGFADWARNAYPVKTRRSLSEAQMARYSRHLLMPEVGEEGQLKLLDAKVLCVGAGGLGSPLAMYLAAAGVGTLGIIDGDAVDMSNLQRQLLHTEDRVGMAKVDSAEAAIAGINSDVRVIKYKTRLDSSNALSILADYDIVADGCDNFPTRYLVNDACFKLGKPNVHGSIFRFDGQFTVFSPGDGPCYRCLYREPPPPELAPSCAEAGVLGILPGIVGVAQAIETIKLILGLGDPLVGRLVTFDALQMRFRTLKIRRDAGCPLCGDQPTITDLVDYEQFCSGSRS